MKRTQQEPLLPAFAVLLITLSVIAIAQQWKADRHSQVPPPVISGSTEDAAAKISTEQCDEKQASCLEQLDEVAQLKGLLLENMRYEPNGILASPHRPESHQLYTLKVGESATTRFECSGDGTHIMYWTGMVTVKSISEIPGYPDRYQAVLTVGDKDYTVSNDAPIVQGVDAAMKVYVIKIEQDKVYMENERNAC